MAEPRGPRRGRHGRSRCLFRQPAEYGAGSRSLLLAGGREAVSGRRSRARDSGMHGLSWPDRSRQRTCEVSGAARPAIGVCHQTIERLRIGGADDGAERHHGDHRQTPVARGHPKSGVVPARRTLTMRSSGLALCLGLALVLAGCGKQQSAVEGSPAGTPNPASAPATAQTGAAAVNPKTAEQASDRPSKITRINEDGSETVEDVPSDSGVHNPLLAAVASTVAASTSTASAATTSATQWQEGVNYKRLLPAQPTEVPAGQVEVLEFFWYACPHCYAIDPAVEAWLKTKAAYINFSRVPVMWNEGHRSLARLFYTLQTLGKLDQLHSDVFKEIHVHGNPLVAQDGNEAETERIQTAFAK